MGWSRLQQKFFFRACSAAGLNDQQRYIVLRHAGCPERVRDEGTKVRRHGGTKGEPTHDAAATRPEVAPSRREAHARGCAGEEPRPSAADSRNNQTQFEVCMAIAESAARGQGRGRDVPRPSRGGSWAEIDALSRDRSIRLIDAMWR